MHKLLCKLESFLIPPPPEYPSTFKVLLRQIAYTYGVRVEYSNRPSGTGHYEIRRRKIDLSKFSEDDKELAITFCHELGHHLHSQRKNTILLPSYNSQIPFKIRWQIEIVADNIGTKLFNKYFPHFGQYKRITTTSDKFYTGYVQAKKNDFPYYFSTSVTSIVDKWK